MIEKITTGMFFTNSYIISNQNDCIIVDPGQRYSKVALKIKNKYNVKGILLTHGHLDHFDGIGYFDCPIYIHELDENKLYNSYLSLYSMVNLETPYKNHELNVVTVRDLDIIELIGYKFQVLHTPGHTSGSVCYNFLDNVFTGDTIFKGNYGRIDFPTGSSSDMLKSLNRILNYYKDEYVVYPGHDDTTTIKNEKKNRYYE